MGINVAIAGAGLGGLCLAQGLVRGGADVTVYERDPGPGTRRQGYRLHLDARAGLALRACLPPDLFDLFLATCGQPGRTFTVLTDRLKVLHETSGDPGRDPLAPETLSVPVNRLTLREILLTGLGDRVRFGHELVGYDLAADHVVARFADGTTQRADVLVGADGVQSAVRRAHLPHATVEDTGNRIIYGKTETLSRVPAAVHNGFAAIIGSRVGLAVGLVRFRGKPGDAGLTPARDYLMWAVSARAKEFPPLDDAGAAELHRVAMDMLDRWHPDLRALVAAATVDETFLIRVRAATPVPPWAPSRVTLLGDAIHAMSPARGSGANTALQDAAALSEALRSAPADPTAAIGAYEHRMREYGFAAVAASREAEATTVARRNRLAFWLLDHLRR